MERTICGGKLNKKRLKRKKIILIESQLKPGQENRQFYLDFVGISFLIYNGKKFIPITISEDMVGHKFGEFAPTRQFFGHTPADKKAKESPDTTVRNNYMKKNKNNDQLKLLEQ